LCFGLGADAIKDVRNRMPLAWNVPGGAEEIAPTINLHLMGSPTLSLRVERASDTL